MTPSKLSVLTVDLNAELNAELNVELVERRVCVPSLK